MRLLVLSLLLGSCAWLVSASATVAAPAVSLLVTNARLIPVDLRHRAHRAQTQSSQSQPYEIIKPHLFFSLKSVPSVSALRVLRD
jgi:hypothetical protein